MEKNDLHGSTSSIRGKNISFVPAGTYFSKNINYTSVVVRKHGVYNAPNMNVQEKTLFISQHAFFRFLTPNDQIHLAEIMREKRYHENEIIIEQSSVSDTAHIILAGSVKVYRLSENGEEIGIALLGPRDIIGEMALIDQEPRSAFVQALQPTATLSVNSADFKKLITNHPTIALSLLEALTKKLRLTNTHLEEVTTENLLKRTHKTLEVLEQYFPNGVITHSHEELALIIGATRSRVTEHLNRLEKEGKITLSHRSITLC